MKKTYKSQQFKLPLIDQLNKPYIGPLSKESTKRSIGTSRNSNENGSREKQKKSPKPSNFNPFIQNLPISQQRTVKKKELSKSFGHPFSQTLSDFEEKIKQNKILLKKFQLQKQIEKQNLQINQRKSKRPSIVKKPYSLEKENSNSEFITSNSKVLLSAVNSRKLTKHDSPKNKQNRPGKENRRYFGSMEQGNTNPNQVKAITEIDEVLTEDIRNKPNPLDRLNKKIKPNDIFQNIHVLLKGLQSEGSLPEKQIKMEKVHQKLIKYKQKLQKIQPGSSFLASINQKIKNNQSLPLIPKVDHDNFDDEEKFKRQTMYPWQRFAINSKKEINKFPTSFKDQIEKVDLYLNKGSTYLEQLLKNRIRMLDLALLKKINSKRTKNKPKLFRKD